VAAGKPQRAWGRCPRQTAGALGGLPKKTETDRRGSAGGRGRPKRRSRLAALRGGADNVTGSACVFSFPESSFP